MDDYNDTPLHVAVLNGNEQFALSLLNEFGYDINIRGCFGRSLLHRECRGGNVSLVQSFHNADINILDDENYTPLHVAIIYG